MAKDEKVCEKCGHCPTCGRGPVVVAPYPWPTYPWYPAVYWQRTYPTWTVTNVSSRNQLTGSSSATVG